MCSVAEITQRVLSGGHIEQDECVWLLSRKSIDVLELGAGAAQVRRHFCGEAVALCSIVNAKSGGCPEDCSFCGQSARYATGVPSTRWLAPQDILASAQHAEAEGASRFCIVMTGRGPGERELELVLEATRLIKAHTHVDVDCSLGMLSQPQAQRLAEAGVSMYNHNLETSARVYARFVSTHAITERVETVHAVRSSGMQVCCGGILGLGEDPEDRVRLAMELRALNPDRVPINILSARPGTPLEGAEPVSPMDVIKAVSMFRYVLPRAIIILAGGREQAMRDLQALGLLAGANGLIVGNYLTTLGQSPAQDRQMIRDLGMSVMPPLPPAT